MGDAKWWDCEHKRIGLPGCPTCDPMMGRDIRLWMRQARDEISRLRVQLRQTEEREKAWAEAASPVKVAQ